MKNNIKAGYRRFTSLLLSAVLLFLIGAVPIAYASSSLDDLKEQYEQLEKKIRESQKQLDAISSNIDDQELKLKTLNSQIDDLNAQMDIIDSRMALLNNQIGTLNTKITKLDSEIAQLDAQILAAQNQIQQKQQAIDDTYTLLQQRLRSAYIAGNSSEIEILLSSEDLSSFLTRTELLKRVAENDNQLIENLRADKKALGKLSASLESDKAKLVDKKAEINSDRAELLNKKADVTASANSLSQKQTEASAKSSAINAIIAKLDKSSDAYKAQIAEYERREEIASQKIQEYIKSHGSNTGGDSDPQNDGKMGWPMPYSNCYISAPFGHYYGSSTVHKGIDICVHGGTEGKRIVAAQGGKVLTADSSDYSTYGRYIIIDHGSGLFTLYAHCSSLAVSEGSTVKKGQTIAYAGSTGNVTGPHLHFEVRINDGSSDDRVNPLNYFNSSVVANINSLRNSTSQIDVVLA